MILKLHMKFIQAILLVSLVLLTVSCEKLTLPEETSHSGTNLTLTVNQLEQMPFASSTRATTVSDACTRINFAIYDAEGTRVKQINQKVGDSDFGTASFQLEPGTYRFVAIAHSSNGNPTMTNAAKIQFNKTIGFTDTFLYSDNITISDEPLTLDLTLNRIVALCRFVINDNIPSTISTLEFVYTGGSGTFDASTGLGSVKSTQTVTFSDLQGQKQFDLYTFLHDLTGTIHLKVRAYDTTNITDATPVHQREFDIPLQQNQITRFSGTFFSGDDTPISRSTSATVTINTQWDGQETITY